MAMMHVSRSGQTLGVFEEEKVREGLRTGEFIGTDLGWMEGMPAWRPLSEMDDFRTPPPPQADVPPVAAQPLASATTPDTTATALRTGLPWENQDGRGVLDALIETIKLVGTKTDAAFAIMRREGGFGNPLLYALILGTAGGLMSIGFSFGMRSLGIFTGRNNGFAALAGLGFGFLGFLILLPMVIVLSSFLVSGIMHVCLMIVGGANQPYETTFRVFCFASGTANVLQIVPVCGGALAGIASLAFNCIGLARAHETDTWRALVAILLPLVVCCGGLGLILFAVFASAAGSHWH